MHTCDTKAALLAYESQKSVISNWGDSHPMLNNRFRTGNDFSTLNQHQNQPVTNKKINTWGQSCHFDRSITTMGHGPKRLLPLTQRTYSSPPPQLRPFLQCAR